jgi:hypothetical protein
MRGRLAQILLTASERLRRRGRWPRYVIRVAARFNDAIRIAYAARNDPGPWSDDLIGLARDVLLEEQGVDISVFGAHTADRFEPAHALAVMASSISTEDFDAEKRGQYLRKLDDARPEQTGRGGKKAEVKDDFARKVVSFIIPSTLFGAGSLRLTPQGNLNFGPADSLHHDAVPESLDDLARSLLEGIKRGEVVCTFLRQPEYRTQAAVALSWCVEHFGDLSDGGKVDGWRDGATLSAEEQLERLRVIAGDRGIQSRVELNR